MNTISTKPILVSSVKEELTKRKGEGELDYEQTQALEHAEKVCDSNDSKTLKLAEELRKKKLPEETVIKILDVMPNNASTLKAILLREKVDVSDGDLEEILKSLKK